MSPEIFDVLLSIQKSYIQVGNQADAVAKNKRNSVKANGQSMSLPGLGTTTPRFVL